jgi:hypothetical protein
LIFISLVLAEDAIKSAIKDYKSKRSTMSVPNVSHTAQQASTQATP